MDNAILQGAIVSIRYEDALRLSLYLHDMIDIDERDDQGYTLLHHAVNEEKLSMVNLLLYEGANPNILDKMDRTPLHIAAAKNNVEIVQRLLENPKTITWICDGRGYLPIGYTSNSYIKLLLTKRMKQEQEKGDHVLNMPPYMRDHVTRYLGQ